MFDKIIKNGNIIDGSGLSAYKADIGIVKERIVKIGDLGGKDSQLVIDADGKYVTPGFIDMHSHADMVILAYPQMDSMIRQGITTFVGCQCGHSIAPVGKLWEGSQAFYDLLYRVSDKLTPDMYNRDYYSPSEKIIPIIESEYGFSPTWQTMGEFLDEIDRHGLSGNIITLSGYNTLRLNAADPDYATKLTSDEKFVIKRKIREALESGAFGMSTGLDYKPGVFADTDELVEMASELKPYDGIYFSHWRKTGPRFGTPKKQKKIDGIKEALEIGLRNNLQVQISHLSTGFDVFPSNDPFMQIAAAERTLQVIEEYVKQGANANFDVIPNITGGTVIFPDLASIFRPWYTITNGVSLFVNNLKYSDYLNQIKEFILAGKFFNLNPVVTPDWDEWMTVISHANLNYVGKTIKQIGIDNHSPSIDQVFELLVEDPRTKIFMASHSMNFPAVKLYLHHPLACVGNDTFVFDLKSTMSYNEEFPNRKPNPNTYCGFIKFLTELGMPNFEDSIQKITGKPASILGLSDRGLIKEGNRADLLLINFEELKTNENLIEPRIYPLGIETVLVNGTIVLDNYKQTGALPGGTIRSYSR